MTVLHLHIHLDHITDNTAQAIRLILDGIEAGLAADEIDEIDDTPEPPAPPGPTVTIPEIILPDEHDAHQAAQQLVCNTCGTTRYTDLRGLRSHERSHETILCDCGPPTTAACSVSFDVCGATPSADVVSVAENEYNRPSNGRPFNAPSGNVNPGVARNDPSSITVSTR